MSDLKVVSGTFDGNLLLVFDTGLILWFSTIGTEGAHLVLHNAAQKAQLEVQYNHYKGDEELLRPYVECAMRHVLDMLHDAALDKTEGEIWPGYMETYLGLRHCLNAVPVGRP